MNQLRKDLPELPERIRKLPLDPRGYPIPWFVITLEDGTRDFRIADQEKRARAARDRLCWICGEKLGRNIAFVIGPMCAVNRNTSEPGSHRDCAEFAVIACPFLTRPKAQYRKANLPDGVRDITGALPGNPGTNCIWITREFYPYRAGADWLIHLGEPSEVLWYCEGKLATKEQIHTSLEARLPALRQIAKEQDGPAGEVELERLIDVAKRYLPA